MKQRIDASSILRRAAQAAPSRPFLALADDPTRIYSYGDFDTLVNRLANALHAMGVGPGQFVNVMLPNCLEYLSTSYALKRLGAVEVAINTEFKGPALTRILNLCSNAVLIVADEFAASFQPIIAELNTPRALVIVGPGERLAGLPWGKVSRFGFQDLVTGGSPRDPAIDVHDTDPCMVLFTSGTTGPSKGCLVPHRCVVRSAEIVRDALRLSKEDNFYTPYPLFHMRASVLDILPTILVGGRVTLARRFSASRFWADMRSNDVTVFSIIGTVMNILWKQPQLSTDRAHRVRITWGGPITVKPTEFRERFGIEVLPGEGCFGMSETGMISISSLDRQNSGKVVPTFEVRIADDNDDPVDRGEIGEILVRPVEPGIMFTGYLAMPEATLGSWRNLWFHTGDFGQLDDEGRLIFKARKREMIRHAGHNISCWEVEEVLNQHPAVQECAILGVDSELGEQNVRAFVVLRHGEAITAEALLRYCSQHMAAYMVPEAIEFTKEIPKTETGKQAKWALAATTPKSAKDSG